MFFCSIAVREEVFLFVIAVVSVSVCVSISFSFTGNLMARNVLHAQQIPLIVLYLLVNVQ